MRTIPDLQELDKEVSSGHERLPFLHLSLFRIPFISSLCLSIPLLPSPSIPEPFQHCHGNCLWKNLALLRKKVCKVEEEAVYNKHSWP